MSLLPADSLAFCLSGRVFERSYAENALPLDDFFRCAASNDFTSVELRDSQVGIDSPAADIDRVNALSEELGINVELITARKAKLDDEGGYAVFKRYLALANKIKCAQIKVAGSDHGLLRRAAEAAAACGVKIGTNNHIGTPWETKAGTLAMLRKIDHPNFHCLFDPSHLWLKGETMDAAFLDALFDRISFVILQDYVVGEGDGFSAIGGVSVRPIGLGERGVVGYPAIIRELSRRGYAGAYGLVQVRDGVGIPADSKALKAHCAGVCRVRE